MYGEKLALGVIIRSVTDHSPMLDFLENAEQYGHQISKLIICYKQAVSEEALKTISEKCDVQLIKLGNSTWLWEKLENLNLSAAEISFLIGPPKLKDDELAPYGICRNHVLLAAILQNLNYLFFFDSDIFPKILVDRINGKYIFKDIDFIGSHLKYLNSCSDIVATTSDYTGFYIIPRMNFPELRKLLYGLQKEDRYYYITSVDSPVMRNYCFKNILNTMKLLGGNMALNLNKLDLIPPFFPQSLV